MGKHDNSLVAFIVGMQSELLKEFLDAPKLQSLLRNRNQENLDFFFFGDRLDCSDCDIFHYSFSFTVQ